VELVLLVTVLPLRAQNPAPGPTPSPPSAAGAQAAPKLGGTAESTKQKIRVRVQLVNVPVSVLDKRGLPVIDLTQNDFRVYEDGKLQAIRFFRREPPLPLWIVLILDTSNSARRQLSFQKDAANQFVYEMLQGRTSKNVICLQTFDATASVVQDFTNDPEVLNDKINGLKAGGGKAFYDAIYFACREKMLHAGEPANVRRVVVIISDGVDVQSRHSLDEAISMAHRAETAIYTIGNSAFGYDNPGDKTLRQVASDTGGAAYFPLEKTPGADMGSGYLSHGQIGDTSQNKGLGAETGAYSAQRLIQMADSLELIYRELDGQYSIGYTPTNNVLDGTYRSIRVETLRKGVQVRSKVGYFASPAEE
jgi:VWFA-related protein